MTKDHVEYLMGHAGLSYDEETDSFTMIYPPGFEGNQQPKSRVGK